MGTKREIKDGGSVFPGRRKPHVECIPGEGCRVSGGMSLRDYFAGQALAGLASLGPSAAGAELAYEIADKMLAARGPK